MPSVNGLFAALMFTLGTYDMGENYCPTVGCLAPQKVEAYDSYSIHQNWFNDADNGQEIFFGARPAMPMALSRICGGCRLAPITNFGLDLGME